LTPTKREYGSGSITWLDNTRAQLRVRAKIDGTSARFSKVVRVTHKNHGGRGEAADELDQFQTECEQRQAIEANSATLAQLMTEYTKFYETLDKAQGSVEQCRTAAGRIPAELGSKPISRLGAHDLDGLYGELRTRLSANSVRVTHSFIRSALNQAVKWGWLTANPAKDATPPGATKGKTKPLPPADVHRMIVAALTPRANEEFGDVVLGMVVVMATLTGARRGELCGLRWGDLDADECSIKIERQWVNGDHGQYLKDATKSEHGDRKVYLGEVGLALIERYRNVMRTMLNREPEGWLLSYDAGATPLRAKALSERISTLAKKVDLDVTTHSLRKVQATQLVAAGVDVDTAARRMGHTKEVMLADYLLGSEDKSIAAATVLEARIVEQGLNLPDVFATIDQ
jgi:integrase